MDFRTAQRHRTANTRDPISASRVSVTASSLLVSLSSAEVVDPPYGARCVGTGPGAFVRVRHTVITTRILFYGGEEKKNNIQYDTILQIRDNTALHGRGRFDWFVFVFVIIVQFSVCYVFVG